MFVADWLLRGCQRRKHFAEQKDSRPLYALSDSRGVFAMKPTTNAFYRSH